MKKYKNRKWLKEKYKDEGLNTNQIAKICGCSSRNIRKWMDKFNLPRRSISEVTSGKNHPMYGKKHTLEAREKMSKSHRGKILSEETRMKMSKSFKGRKHLEETKRKISKAHWKGGCERIFMNYSRLAWVEGMGQEIPENHHIHHHDKNRRNIKPSNLHCCLQGKHNSIHTQLRSMNEEEQGELISELRWNQVCAYVL